jgi:RHS repeat-associated protein
VTDSNGDVQERYRYDAYGTVTALDSGFAPTGNPPANDWETLYASYRWDSKTGLYHIRNRAYHPALGRWMQRDPLEYVGGWNLYEYLSSTPLNGVDPLGFVPCNAANEGQRRGVALKTVFVAGGDLSPAMQEAAMNVAILIALLGDTPTPGGLGGVAWQANPKATNARDLLPELVRLKDFKKLVRANAGQASVWTRLQCEVCKCTNWFQYFRGKFKWEWVTVGDETWVRCDLSKTEWGKTQKKLPGSVPYIDEKVFLFDLLDGKDLSTLKEQCTEQATRSCEN